MSESTFQKRLMIALSRVPGVRVWRQNTGGVTFRDAKTGSVRRFDAGPPKGAADVSGIVKPHGWRIEIECKAVRGRLSKEQRVWRDFIVASGGIYLLASERDGVDAVVESVRSAVEARKEKHHAP